MAAVLDYFEVWTRQKSGK